MPPAGSVSPLVAWLDEQTVGQCIKLNQVFMSWLYADFWRKVSKLKGLYEGFKVSDQQTAGLLIQGFGRVAMRPVLTFGLVILIAVAAYLGS